MPRVFLLTMTMPMNSEESRRPFSPTARAFFAALDGTGDAESQQQDKKKKKMQSESIQKRAQALGWRNRYSQDEVYPIEVGRHSFSVRQVQRGEIDGTYGTGATVWPASLVLIKYLEQTGLVAGKHVVDLGAGTGVTSIAAALLGAASCTCTDGEEPVVRLSRDNIRAVAQAFPTPLDDVRTMKEEPSPSSAEVVEVETDHSGGAIMILGCPISTQQYWWGAGRIDTHYACDVILVSDCVLPKLYPMAHLVEALDQLLRRGEAASAAATMTGTENQQCGAMALLSYEYRFFPDYDPKEKFIELCAARNLIVTSIPQSEHHQLYSLDDVELWKVSVLSSPNAT